MGDSAEMPGTIGGADFEWWWVRSLEFSGDSVAFPNDRFKGPLEDNVPYRMG